MIRPTLRTRISEGGSDETYGYGAFLSDTAPAGATRPVVGRARGEGKRLAGLTRESEQTILYNACTIFGYLVLLSIAFWAMGGGVVATVDTDVYGPDELAHAQAGRYGE